MSQLTFFIHLVAYAYALLMGGAMTVSAWFEPEPITQPVSRREAYAVALGSLVYVACFWVLYPAPQFLVFVTLATVTGGLFAGLTLLNIGQISERLEYRFGERFAWVFLGVLLSVGATLMFGYSLV